MKPPIKLGNKSESDIVLVVGDQDFHVHKEKLASHSDVFDQMFQELPNHDRIEVKDVDPVTFRRLLELLYKNKISDANECILFPPTDVKRQAGRQSTCTHRLGSNPHGLRTRKSHYVLFVQEFWKAVKPLQEMAARFKVTDILEKYLTKVTDKDMQMDKNCPVCLNAFVFAVQEGLKVRRNPFHFHEETFNEWYSIVSKIHRRWKPPKVTFEDLEDMCKRYHRSPPNYWRWVLPGELMFVDPWTYS